MSNKGEQMRKFYAIKSEKGYSGKEWTWNLDDAYIFKGRLRAGEVSEKVSQEDPYLRQKIVAVKIVEADDE